MVNNACVFVVRFHPTAISIGAISAGILNQPNSFFPNEFFKTAGGMARFINAEIAFHLNRCFPLAFLVFEPTADNTRDVVRFGIRAAWPVPKLF